MKTETTIEELKQINRKLLIGLRGVCALADSHDKAQRGNHQEHWAIREAKATIAEAERKP